MSTILTVKNKCGLSWRFLGVVLACLAGFSARAQVMNLPFYEPFPSAGVSLEYTNQIYELGYENDEELGQSVTEANGASSSSTIWTFGNSISSSCSRILTTNGQSGLEYPGLVNVDAVYQTGLLGFYVKDTGSTKERAVQLNIPPSSTTNPMTLYASVLLNIQTNIYATANGYQPFFGLTTNMLGTSVNQAGAVIYLSNAFNLMLGKASSTPDLVHFTPALTPSNTYLLVLRYKYNPGTNDQVDLWVDPIALGSNAVVPPPTITTTNNSNLSSNFFGAVGIFELANPPGIYLDEIRVATNWGGVTPNTPAPGTIYSVTGGGAGCGDTGFDVGLSGVDPNVVYYLYTNGIPTGQSISSPTNTFGPQTATANYTVLGSNTVTGNVGWMAGSATVSLLTAPTITTQPVPTVVATGELAAFSVTAAGGGESYQWYHNGSSLSDAGEFSGTQTPNLVVYPATETDAGGYNVIIANACGTKAVSSTTNALTLDTPANLEWYGDGVSNLWDVNVSTNWNTNTAVFHYGDDVTFDDNSTNPTVTLNSSYLSPSMITINGSANTWVFTGFGSLVGSGSFLMNSANTITLSTPNSMSGGMTISNGAVIFEGGQTLGTGPITLAGGLLEAANIGLVTVTNVISINGSNSAISCSATGGQDLVLTNALAGVSGNLTFENTANKNGAPVIELTAPFTFGLLVTLNPGTSDLGITLENANTTGSETWNNSIEGAGELWRDGVGGTTILNDTNNYTGDSSGLNSESTMIGTLLTDGALGVGADSTNDINGNLIGALGNGALVVDTRGSTPQLFASGGPHVVSNLVTFYTNFPGPAFVITGGEELTLGGGIDLNETNRVMDVSNTAPTVISGPITDDGYNQGLTVTGPGSLYLDATNIYTGATTNMAGLLAGNGSVDGPVVVASGSSLGGGTPSAIGTFSINGNLTLDGNVFIRVNNSQAQPNDSIAVTGTLTNIGSGVVTISNTGPALAAGDTFPVFNSALVNGGSLIIVGGGVTWVNHLAENGSITAGSRIVIGTPGINAVSISSGNLIFSGTNGTAGYTYYILSTTNLALPLSDWTVVSTNVFTGSAFSVTNAVGSGSKYFVLEVP